MAEVARESRARLLAILASRERDLHAAEDALADAFAQALETWPVEGVPTSPVAWLLTASRRRLIDGLRRSGSERARLERLARTIENEVASNLEIEMWPDERLKLLFIAAHPAVEASARAPLMLQLVFGLDAATIASAFLASPSAMSGRLVRAKNRIRELGISFDVPESEELPSRLRSVLDTIYAVFGTAWEPADGTEVRWTELRDEAIRLGRLLVELLPGRPEAEGLLALMLHCEARRPARRDSQGRFVPLDEQDVALWDLDLIEEAERRLASAARHRLPGRFQLEAAIQSAHAARRFGRGVDWADIALFYDELLRIEPTIAAATARAAVIARIEGPEAGLAALERLPESAIKDYQPFWATRAELSRSAGLRREAEAAYDRAIGLSDDPGVRAHLLGRRARIVD
ncbi:MAG: DUF6596 domain-containing protein [Isosphaeraceae bacterium]|nr:DUF6596 domain-containing protein [Isosphaeraceae bacterium]